MPKNQLHLEAEENLAGSNNDFNDFKMPYKIYGKQDLANMKNRYSKLNNYSQGLNLRFAANDQI